MGAFVRVRARLAALLLSGLAGACAFAPAPPVTVGLRVVAFNDFHGHLEAPAAGWLVPDPEAPGKLKRSRAGGAAHLASAIRELRGQKAHSVVVGAGDLVGASPLVSSLFHDEPAIGVLEGFGLAYSAVGNHEFDRGRDELLRLMKGGCRAEGCVDGPYAGASFRYLAANLIDTATGKPLLPGYAIREFDGVPVAFVGAVLRATPTMVDRRGIQGLSFLDEADAVNALVPEIRAQGAEAIVLLIHEGGISKGGFDDPACADFGGPIVDIVRRLDKAVDVVVSGHTHQAYRCRVDGRWVTSAGSYGRLVTVIDLDLDRGTKDVAAVATRNLVVEADRYPADPAIAAAVQRVARLAEAKAGRPVGRVRGELSPVANAAGESAIGRLVAQAQLRAMKEAYGAQVAFMNPGGIRAPLVPRDAAGTVTFGDLHSVQPFGNSLVAITLTGAQVLRLLEEQWRAPPDHTRILQVAGISYAWDGSKPRGSRIVPGSVRIDGLPLELSTDYRVAVNSFLFGGGDGFSVLAQGRSPVVGPLDLEALERYMADANKAGEDQEMSIRRVDSPPS